MFGYASDIGVLEPGRIIFTAVGAFQTVDLFESLFVKRGQLPEHFIFIRFVLVRLLEEVQILFMMVGGFLFPIMQ
jgi:hypothetical protein